MKKALIALVAAAVMAVPATAYADTTVGGQSTSAAGCDIKLVSIIVDPSTGGVSSDLGYVDCNLSDVYEILGPLTVCTGAVTVDHSTGEISVDLTSCG